MVSDANGTVWVVSVAFEGTSSVCQEIKTLVLLLVYTGVSIVIFVTKTDCACTREDAAIITTL